MRRVNFLQKIDGKLIKRDIIATGIELILFRNDQLEEFAIFNIQLILRGHVFTFGQFRCDKKKALKDYKKILKELRNAKNEVEYVFPDASFDDNQKRTSKGDAG